MSPRDRALWLQFQRRANALSPAMARDLMDAWRVLRESLDDAELARLIASGRIDQILDDALLDTAFAPLKERILAATKKGFQATAPEMPNVAQAAIAFDTLAPAVIEGVRKLDSRVVNDLKDDARETVRAFVENGLRDGRTPAAVGRELRGVIGLSPTQAQNVANYETKLRALVRHPLTDAQIEKKVQSYIRRAIALNTETVSRTASLDATKLGQKLSWQDAIAKGVVNGADLWKRWVTVGDDRVREEHQAMNGEEVPFGNTYSNGEDVPGESAYNCRCLSRVFVKRPTQSNAA